MSQLTIKLSDKADALIAQLQKEIFNRRRKKVSATGVVETLVESGAKSQSDKRFATSWKNLIADIEKAAKLANAHGAKPANLSDEEWALILSHRNRAAQAAQPAKVRRQSATVTTTATAKATKQRPRKKAAASSATTTATAAAATRRRSSGTSVAKRMSKAAGRIAASAEGSGNGAALAQNQPVA